MKKTKKLYRIEWWEKGIYEFSSYLEAMKFAKEVNGDKVFELMHYKDFRVDRVKKDLSFTKRIEQNSELQSK